MTAIPQWICFHGQAVPVGTAFGPLAVTGSGFVHVTSSVIDGAANLGTAGQYALTNAAGTDTSWVAMSGDSTSSTSTPGKVTNTGLQGIAVPAPSGTSTVLTYNAGAYTWSPAVTAWADDLAGSTNSAQYVAALTGSGGTPGAIPLNASSWISQTAGNIFLKTGTSTVLSVDGSSNTVLNAPSGSGVLLELNGATTVAQLSASASDYAAFGASPATSGFIRLPSGAQTFMAINAAGTNVPILATDTNNNLFFGYGSIPSGIGPNVQLVAPNGVGSSAGGGISLTAGRAGDSSSWAGIYFGWGSESPSDYVALLGSTSESGLGNLQWTKSLTPQLTQANAASNVLATAFSISAQNANPGSTGTANISGGSIVLTPGAPATANGSSGSVSVVLSAPTGTAKEGFLSLTRGANVEMLLGAGPSVAGAALWMGSTQTANANSSTCTLYTTDIGSYTALNVPSGTGQIILTSNAAVLCQATAANGMCFNTQVGGFSSTPYTLASGSPQTILSNTTSSLGNAWWPIQRFSGAANSLATVIKLPYGYRTEYILDFTACTGLGSNTITVQANTATKALTVSSNIVYRVYTDGVALVYSQTYS